MKQPSQFSHKVSGKTARRGFTLIEVILSIAILAFALCGILAAYISCTVFMATSKNVNIATNAAFGLIEEIRSSSFTRIMDNYDGLTFSVNDIPSSMGVVHVDNTNPELLEVTVSICWRQGNRIIGGDTDLDGVVDLGERADANGIFDSPVQLVTRIANR
jgi:prepilin-type N-terminal cleavage/methylation domain-containing protein